MTGSWGAFARQRRNGGGDDRYGNSRAGCARGHSHRSKLEAAVCDVLLLREKAGELRLRQTEKHLLLSKAQIKYIADFECEAVPSGEVFYVEAKGFENDRWPIVKKLYRVYGPGRLEIWRGKRGRPFLDETIIPGEGDSQ